MVAARVRSAFPTGGGGSAPATRAEFIGAFKPRALHGAIYLQIQDDRVYEPYGPDSRMGERALA